jgi:signal transduction histidine kinase
MNVAIDLWRLDAYFDHEAQAVAAWGVVVGLLLLAATLQLIFGLWLRDAVMLAFAAYMGALCSVYLGLSGTGLLVPAHPPSWYSDLLVGAGNLGALALGSLLSMLTLDIRRHLRPAQWLYLVPAGLAVLALPLVVTDHYGSVAVAVNLWGMVLSLVNMGLALWVWRRRQRDRERLVYLLACWCMGAGIVVRVLQLLGLVSASPLASLAYPVATVVYLVLMLLAMGIRLASLCHDKLLAQERVAEERRFAAMVAHEFRNPLAGIDRAANLLQLIPQMTPAQTAQRLSGIRRQAARLNTLVDSFLHAEPVAARVPQQPAEALALAPWLEALRQDLDDEARERLTVAVQPAGLRARFDASLVKLALHNLVDNALRYSPEDRPVLLQASADAHLLELQVIDQGPGLTPDDLARLGQAYHRGAASIGRQGSGLGYHFCQRIAGMLGGQLQAASLPGHGLRVTLSLPLRP